MTKVRCEVLYDRIVLPYKAQNVFCEYSLNFMAANR